MRLNYYFNTSMRADFSITGVRYAFNTTDQQEPPQAYEHSYFIDDYRVNTNFTHDLSSKNTLRTGQV